MAKQSVAWDFTDLQSKYERAQLLANDCTQDFAGNYFFPSDRSPKGYWTTTRKQRLDYVCDCPDFAQKIEQQITSSAPSRWVRGDWSTRPDNRILVNRCLHCLAVAIAEQELDSNFPVNRIYQAKRSRYPKTDCGCGCGGSGDCGCPSKELGLPEPKLIQGCDTDCYVEPLTARTQRTPSTGNGIPAYQTFEIQKVEFAQTQYRACLGEKITLQLKRSSSQGFNNATVVGLPVDVEIPFSPESRTSAREVTLDFFVPGNYTIGIGAIAVGNFGEELEAQIEILDCENDNIDCTPQDFVDFSDGNCEGSYLVAFRQTGNKNPDGSCEQIKVLQFQEGLDCPFPEDPEPKECESTISRDCRPTELGVPTCVNTGSGDGYNSNAGFNAVVKIQTGGKTTEYLRPDKKECAEYCEFAEKTINSPSCPEPDRKPEPEPFCPIPVSRYLGWRKLSAYFGTALFYTGGISILETFVCGDLETASSTAALDRNNDKTYVLLGYTAKCMAPANRYVDSFAGANYEGDKFGEGCCPFDETKPARPVCPPKPVPPPITKWKCLNGVCVQDSVGTYATQAECRAALIPAGFTGGQCETIYNIVTNISLINPSGNPETFDTNLDSNVLGKITTATFYQKGADIFQDVANDKGYANNSARFIGSTLVSINSITIVREDALPDNCGNPLPKCP